MLRDHDFSKIVQGFSILETDGTELRVSFRSLGQSNNHDGGPETHLLLAEVTERVDYVTHYLLMQTMGDFKD